MSLLVTSLTDQQLFVTTVLSFARASVCSIFCTVKIKKWPSVQHLEATCIACLLVCFDLLKHTELVET